MTKKPKARTYTLTCHVCRFCGMGRILQDVTPGYVTGGGNPIWACSTCLRSGAAMFPSVYCYCGWETSDFEKPYQCWDLGSGPIDKEHFRTFKVMYNLAVVKRK